MAARYAVLLLPVAIYFCRTAGKLPSSTGGAVDVDPAAAKAAMNAKSKGDDFSITFQQLSLAAVYSDTVIFTKTKRLSSSANMSCLTTTTLMRRYKISRRAADAAFRAQPRL